ncbi:MAG: hypothetical protein EA425_15310 [Puniceicoccaceae bacterium]|nr:MAG: hypothetical protein EA425_15310 [Puniceicoccaceae bacterium]
MNRRAFRTEGTVLALFLIGAGALALLSPQPTEMIRAGRLWTLPAAFSVFSGLVCLLGGLGLLVYLFRRS